MEHQDYPALKKILKTDGKLARPVPIGTRFGIIPTQREVEKILASSELPYPPLDDESPGCEFDPETRSLTSTVFGTVRFTNQGIKVIPSWELSSDKTLLTVDVHPVDFNGEDISSGRLLATIPPAAKDLELDFDALNAAMARALESKQNAPAVMARGLLPEPGQDGRLKLTFEPKQAAGSLREDGSIDFRERGGIHFVVEGDELGVLHPPIPGTPGHDIFGAVIPAPVPKPAHVKAGQGVASTHNDADGTTTFKAARAGVAHFVNAVLEVSELLKIPGDVDYESGNIHAEHGSVHIHGAIKSGFKVVASGDVIVDGLIEEADVTAGGLVVAGGIIMSSKNIIQAEGNVTAKFFQNATIRAGGDVTAKLEISHCDIIAGGRILAVGGKGIISGGHVVSGSDIIAKIIGNESRSRTIVEIRLPSPKQDQLTAARNQLTDELGKLDKAIGAEDALTMLMTAPEEDRRILAELVKVRGKIQADIRILDESIAAERKALEELLAERQIKAEQIAFNGTEVIFGGKPFQLTEDMEAPRFHWNQHDRQIEID
ncbi:MAG: FapA family protein [Proteobacteria bacterium]|nr:FapA family protein [Pseudomonadota bacterium]